MFFSAVHFPSHSTGHTFSNRIASVAHAFFSYLAAAKLSRSAEAETEMKERARAKDAEMLYRLANQYEALSPNLSSELRFLASRG